MKKLAIIAAAVVSIPLLTGCETMNNVTSSLGYETGKQVSDVQMNSFVDVKSTKNDVISAVGQPMKKEMLQGTEIWRYQYTYIAPLPFQPNINEASVFEFDGDVMKAHYKTGSESLDPLTQAAAGKLQ